MGPGAGAQLLSDEPSCLLLLAEGDNAGELQRKQFCTASILLSLLVRLYLSYRLRIIYNVQFGRTSFLSPDASASRCCW